MAIHLKDKIDGQVLFHGSQDLEKQVDFALHLIEEDITEGEVSEMLGKEDRINFYLSLILVLYGQELPRNFNDKVKRQVLNLVLEEDLTRLKGFAYGAVAACFHMFGKMSLIRMQKPLSSQYKSLADRASQAFPDQAEKYQQLYQDYLAASSRTAKKYK